nr:methyl-accepting chemotaxis protein [Bacillus marinisedimentorum]
MFLFNSIRKKLIVVSIVLLVFPSVIIGAAAYLTSKSNLDKAGETTLKNGVEMSLQLIDALDQKVEQGTLSLEDAQEQAKTYLIGPKNADGTRDIKSPVDLGENGYFMVYDQKGNEVAHPTLEGKNVWETKDKNGTLLVQEQIKAAQNGGGFTTYVWALPNSENNTGEKITYNALDPNWGWIVSAGTYKLDFNQGANEVLMLILTTLGITFAAGAVIIIFFSRSLAEPIKIVSNHVKQVADGDFTVEELNVKNKDEIGTLASDFNGMVASMRTLIQAVEDSIQQVSASSQNLSAVSEETSAASEEMGNAIQEIAGGAAQQAEDADTTNQKMANLSTQIAKVQEQNEEMVIQSKAAGSASQNGIKQIDILQSKTKEANELTETVANVMDSLSDKVKEIEKVMSAINEISDQTNLLALNASIEAARAGEHGKGFAVVAEEVRKLAEQSSHATEEVRTTLSGIISESDKATAAIKQNQALSTQQTAVTADTEKVFKEIAVSIDSIVSSIEGVSHEITQMSLYKDEVLESVGSIASVAQQSAAATEEVTASTEEQLRAIATIASSAEELNVSGEQLREQIARIKLV